MPGLLIFFRTCGTLFLFILCESIRYRGIINSIDYKMLYNTQINRQAEKPVSKSA